MSDPTPTSAPSQGERGFLSRYEGLPTIGWGASTIAIGVLCAIVAIIFGVGIVGAFDPGLETTAGKGAGQAVIALVLIGTAFAVALIDSDGSGPGAIRRLGFRRVAFAMIGLAALAWLAYSFASLTLGSLLDPEQDPVTDELGTDEGSALSILITGILVVPLAALSEELFFRGFMFAGMRNAGASLWVAAAISSAIWASLHLGAGNVGVVLILAAFGLVLAWLYERSGSLWVPIAAHALNNTVAFVLLLTQ